MLLSLLIVQKRKWPFFQRIHENPTFTWFLQLSPRKCNLPNYSENNANGTFLIDKQRGPNYLSCHLTTTKTGTRPGRTAHHHGTTKSRNENSFTSHHQFFHHSQRHKLKRLVSTITITTTNNNKGFLYFATTTMFFPRLSFSFLFLVVAAISMVSQNALAFTPPKVPPAKVASATQVPSSVAADHLLPPATTTTTIPPRRHHPKVP